MPDINDPYALGFFSAKSDPANLKMREKIALAQMMQKRKVPTNLGEGLYSVGQDIGDALAARSLVAADKEAQAAASKSTPMDAGEITPLAPAPSITPQAGAASSVTAAPIAPVQAPAIVPARPAEPAPADIPGVTRLSTDAQLNDFRAQNPLPVPPPPAARAAPQAMAAASPTPASFGSRFDAAFPNRAPPVVAAGSEPTPTPDVRDAAATALMNQQRPPPGSPQVPQTSMPAPDPGIQKAPPGQAIPGYVPPALADPTGAPIIPPSKRELQLQAVMVKNQGNPYSAQSPDAQELAKLKSDRELRQTEQNELFKAGIARVSKRDELRQGALIGQDKSILESQKSRIEIGDLPGKLQQEATKREQEIADARDKSILQSRFGGRDPEKMFTEFDKEKTTAQQTVNALNQYSNVRDMLEKGVIVGTAQGWKVNAAKVAGMYGGTDAVARTEQMQAALKSTLGLAIANIQGSGQKVSDADIAVASGTIGADPTLQLETIKNLTARAEKIARENINNYEDQKDYYFGGTRAERRYDVQAPPTAAEPYVNKLLEHRTSKEVKDEFDQRFGQGAAELEIARAKRRERRGG